MNRRALVVDDEPAICELIQKVLHSAGMEALTLTRSTEASSHLEEVSLTWSSWTCRWRHLTASSWPDRCANGIKAEGPDYPAQ
jgi:CheY-like chemotaxis protein